MSLIEEYSFLIELDEAGIVKTEDVAALEERIREWLATPEGTLANLPGWGHRLSSLKFEPPGGDTEVMAEMLISEKLSNDVKDMLLKGVAVEFKEIDLLRVFIDYGIGTLQEDIKI